MIQVEGFFQENIIQFGFQVLSNDKNRWIEDSSRRILYLVFQILSNDKD